MKQFIKNTDNQKICVLVEGLENKADSKLVFIQHGLSSSKESDTIRQVANAFLKKGYVVVTFDSRYSFGESDGELESATLTSFIQDLETVINWAKTQNFYVEPFALSGHSLGGGSVLHYAENDPSKIEKIVPVATMVGGRWYLRSYMLNRPDFFEKWREEGCYFRHKKGDEKITGYVSFDLVTDMQNYDLVASAGAITCPTLLVTGEDDLSSTIYNNEHLYEKLGGIKELNILEDCGHTFENEQNKQELYNSVYTWLDKL